MKTVSLIIKVFILLIFLVLAVINRQAVQFNYLPEQSVNAPLIVLLFGMFVIGALFGIFARTGQRHHLEGHEQRHEVIRGGEHHHAAQREQVSGKISERW